MMQPIILTEIVKRAMVDHVTSIGQLSKQEVRELDTAVHMGYLSKGKGGAFPAIKTMWACPGFDFAADRERQFQEMCYRAHQDALRFNDDKYEIRSRAVAV